MRLPVHTPAVRYALHFTVTSLILIACGGGTATDPGPSRGTGGPQFLITSPTTGSSVSGPIFFSVQPFDPSEVQRVTFKAADTELEPQYPGEDMFKVFLMPRDFPDGELTLTAIITGKSGKQSQQTMTVTVVANPPSQATVTRDGAILGTVEENGAVSVLTIPSGVAEGANVSFEAQTQEQVKQATGVDYEALGVTFLGAQEINSDTPIDRTLMVSSGGFGPMVQPGQAVVNYMIAPDGDGNGSGELVVVNTASVAPNGDVISDPVPHTQIALASPSMLTGSRGQRVRHALPATPPGGQITFNASGFNAANTLSNLVVLRTAGQTFTTFATYVIDAPPDASTGVIAFVVPDMPPGLATLEFANLTTNFWTRPVDVLIADPVPLTDSPHEVVAGFLTAAIEYYASSDGEYGAGLADALMLLKQELAFLQVDASPETEDVIASIARVVAGAGSTFEPAALAHVTPQQVSCMSEGARNAEMRKANVVGAIGDVLTGGRLPPQLVAIGWGLQLGAGFIRDHTNSIPPCPPGGLPPPTTEPPPLFAAPPAGVCTPSNPTGLQGPSIGPRSVHPQQATSGTMTGMGSALPPGGTGCGSARGGNSTGEATRLSDAPGFFRQSLIPEWLAQEPGRYIVKIFVGAAALPFTGVTDASGYFFVPLIPEHQPFTAVATDTLTGTVRTFEGIGPELGDNVLMFFDFVEADDERPSISLDSNLSGSIEPGAVEPYTFVGDAGDIVRVALHTNELNLGIVATLLGPSGEVIDSTDRRAQFDRFHRIPERELLDSGTYTIVVASNMAATVEYTLGLAEIASPAALEPGSAGAIFSGDISALYDMDLFAFQADASSAAKLVLSHPETSSINASVSLRRPDGNTGPPIGGTSSGVRSTVIGPRGLVDAGTYVLGIEAQEGVPTLDSYMGTYDAMLYAPPVLTVPLSTNHSGTVTSQGIATYRISSPTPQLGTVAVAAARPEAFDSAYQYGAFELMSDGGGLQTRRLETNLPVGYAQFGVVDLEDYPAAVVNSLQDDGLDFQVAVTPLPAPIDFGSDRPSMAASGDLDLIGEIVNYTFSGTEGEVVTLTLQHPELAELHAHAELYRLDTGGRLGTARTNAFTRTDTFSTTLSSTGSYRIFVSTLGATASHGGFESLDQILGPFELLLEFE